MLYQKARILENASVPVEGWGKLIWVVSQPPQAETTLGLKTGKPQFAHVYFTNLVRRKGKMIIIVCLSQSEVELLPEFREDVPLIELDDWLTEDSCPT